MRDRPTEASPGQRRLARPLIDVARDVVMLTKPGLTSLVVATTAIGVRLASGTLSTGRALVVIAATTLLVGAANMLNAYLERDIDARMERTQNRPLAAGRLEPRFALVLGVVLAVVTTAALAVAGSLLAAFLGATAFIAYVGMYTPLKRYSSWAVAVGAIPGAIPAALGVTAVTGKLDGLAMALFSIVYLWQLPHFLAISIYLKRDYIRGGLKVFAVMHGELTTTVAIIASAVALLPATYAVTLLGVGGRIYEVTGTLASLAFLAASAAGLFAKDKVRWARSLFLGSLGYMAVLLAALALGAS
jgi:protoheme IX farnesyltransferase